MIMRHCKQLKIVINFIYFIKIKYNEENIILNCVFYLDK